MKIKKKIFKIFSKAPNLRHVPLHQLAKDNVEKVTIEYGVGTGPKRRNDDATADNAKTDSPVVVANCREELDAIVVEQEGEAARVVDVGCEYDNYYDDYTGGNQERVDLTDGLGFYLI